MSVSKIVEGNKLIAEFIGMKPMKSEGWEHCYIGAIKPEDLTFHNDWSLLMSVVEKIEEIKGMYEVMFKRYYVKVKCINPFGLHDISSQSVAGGVTKKEAVWLAVVSFIKWHNKEQKDERSVATTEAQRTNLD